MQAPEGYAVDEGKVCKLRRSLYGLKQASREWNAKLTTQLVKFGFEQSMHEHCLFILKSEGCLVILQVYIDDVLFTGTSNVKINEVKMFLNEKFTIKDLDSVKYFLGLEFTKSVKGLYVNQRKYIVDMLEDAWMIDCKPAHTPLPKD